ncbi:MAG: hypothetical protein ACYCSN_12095 [Acidobacteriaceae bacterium]
MGEYTSLIIGACSGLIAFVFTLASMKLKAKRATQRHERQMSLDFPDRR